MLTAVRRVLASASNMLASINAGVPPPISVTSTSRAPISVPPLFLPLPEPQSMISELLDVGISLPIATHLSSQFDCRGHAMGDMITQNASRLWFELSKKPSSPGMELIELRDSLIRAFTADYKRQLGRARVAILSEARKVVENAEIEARRRNTFNTEYTSVLEESFLSNPFPNQAEKRRLAEVTKMNYRQIHVWFQNRRCRSKTTRSLTQRPSSHRSRSNEDQPSSKFPPPVSLAHLVARAEEGSPEPASPQSLSATKTATKQLIALPWLRQPSSTTSVSHIPNDIENLVRRMSACSISDRDSSSSLPVIPQDVPHGTDQLSHCAANTSRDVAGFLTRTFPAPLPSLVRGSHHPHSTEGKNKSDYHSVIQSGLPLTHATTRNSLFASPSFARSGGPRFAVIPTSEASCRKRGFTDVEEAALPCTFISALATNKRRKVAGLPSRRPQTSFRSVGVHATQSLSDALHAKSAIMPPSPHLVGNPSRSYSSTSIPDLIRDSESLTPSSSGSLTPFSSRQSSFTASPNFGELASPLIYSRASLPSSPVVQVGFEDNRSCVGLDLETLASAVELSPKTRFFDSSLDCNTRSTQVACS